MKLILASNSKLRKQILENVGFKFEVVVSDLEEISNEKEIDKFVMDLSKQKAENIAKNKNDCVIIAADTIVFFDGKIIGKPKSKQEAIYNLNLLSGKVNYVYTGVTIIDTVQNKQVMFCDITEIEFNKITDDEIKYIVDNEEYILERAGYSLSTLISLFIKKINGDYNGALGLPISKVYCELKKFGYETNDFT